MGRFSDMSLFKDCLLASLESNKMSSAALADKTGVARSRISEFTRGLSLPKDDTLVLICEAFSPKTGAALASAWIRERLGAVLADAILASETLSGTTLEKVYNSLPSTTQRAFFDLMTISREDADLRSSLESLASFARPDEQPAKIVQYITGGGAGGLSAAVAEEHNKNGDA